MFKAYIYLTNTDSGETIKIINMNVREREKPTDYTTEDYVDVVTELNNKLNQIIATGIANYEPDPTVVDDCNRKIVGDQDLSKDTVAKTDLETAWWMNWMEKINSSKVTTTLAVTEVGFIHDAKTVGGCNHGDKY